MPALLEAHKLSSGGACGFTGRRSKGFFSLKKRPELREELKELPGQNGPREAVAGSGSLKSRRYASG
jgi:hypothetical protein